MMHTADQAPDGWTPPAIVLVGPQMGENIGAAARVMGNFGLRDLRIVAPRDGWPNPKADAVAAGAFDGPVTARVFADVAAAVADLTFTAATTARPRGLVKPVLGPLEAFARVRAEAARGGQAGLLFGAEASGLPNDVVAGADVILTFPIEPGFSSLNLAQAVGVAAYGWRVAGAASDEIPTAFAADAPKPAPLGMLEAFLVLLETELDARRFFFPPHKAPTMKRNLRAMFARIDWSEPELNTLHGVVRALIVGRGALRTPEARSAEEGTP